MRLWKVFATLHWYLPSVNFLNCLTSFLIDSALNMITLASYAEMIILVKHAERGFIILMNIISVLPAQIDV